ncbi:unnamed protein product [Sphenostylis stenocarpa]|uniref:Uncharacterized protein n=1 Tax=Sphenostylis stenocarpa TaxID=92480 RepID=A0AA86SYV7_9FABA|nr:unnamed protein product [Sphenostylis stenocarpa]
MFLVKFNVLSQFLLLEEARSFGRKKQDVTLTIMTSNGIEGNDNRKTCIGIEIATLLSEKSMWKRIVR